MGNCLGSSSLNVQYAPASSKRRREEATAGILSSPRPMPFSFKDLKNSTRNFRADRFLGEGEFGRTYKGWIDDHTLTAARPGSGLPIAVKKLNHLQDWLTKVNFLGQLRHPNIVKLLGFCSEGENRLLVYEFMQKGSLENHLFGRGPQLDWATRIKVAIGAARGLSFLHEEAQQQAMYICFKASNILLDGEFNAKLSDFGLAARAGDTGNNHTFVDVPITAAPEYVQTGHLSTKTDVYSFGVVLLELLSGRRVYDGTKTDQQQHLVGWVDTMMGNKRKLLGTIDTKLEGKYPQREALSVLEIALQCLNDHPNLRPNMVDVLSALEAAANPNT